LVYTTFLDMIPQAMVVDTLYLPILLHIHTMRDRKSRVL